MKKNKTFNPKVQFYKLVEELKTNGHEYYVLAKLCINVFHYGTVKATNSEVLRH